MRQGGGLPGTIVVIAGPAGAGKTTLGCAVAELIPHVVLDLDTVSPLVNPARLPDRDERYATILRLAKENAARGLDCLLIAPFTSEITDVERWRRFVARLAPARVQLIVVRLPPGEARRRRSLRGLARDRIDFGDTSRSDASRSRSPKADPRLPAIWVDGLLSPGHNARVIVNTLVNTEPDRATKRETMPQANSAQTPTWSTLPSHQNWLTNGTSALIRFAQTSIRAEGGFHYQAADGRPEAGKEPLCFLTARLVHASAIGLASGIPGSGRLLDHGMISLLGVFFDSQHGGFHHDLTGVGRKSVYDQVQVAMAASSALAVGHPQAQDLIEKVTASLLEHAWSTDEQALRESFAADWSDSEDYRGANSNMHGVEAMLALGDVTGDPAWHERALAVATRIIDGEARKLNWLIPEHYTAEWQVDTEYNAAHPKDAFRPYGATFGHSFEWARFLLYLHLSSHLEPQPWLVEAAIGLTSRALESWGIDGVEGMVYTVDWDGQPVARERLHWPVCEAIQTVHVLQSITGDGLWENWYRRLWDHAQARFIDEHGTWINELDVDLVPSAEIWPGRPDYYHCIGAYTVPRVPGPRFMTLALAQGSH